MIHRRLSGFDCILQFPVARKIIGQIQFCRNGFRRKLTVILRRKLIILTVQSRRKGILSCLAISLLIRLRI
jgi:hypothetical protein